MNFQLHIWRQDNTDATGRFEIYQIADIDPDASFLEMLDVLNDQLLSDGKSPVAFDSDCREGICGACSLVINSVPHGPGQSTSCQVFMREFTDGSTIRVEPFRNRAFPVLRDLMIDRSAFDRIQQAGGYISVTTGPKPEPNATPVRPSIQEQVMDAAACIGCGACVAACPNGAAMLFTGAKVTHLSLLPQGKPERANRAHDMVAQMDAEGFGGCTNHGECQEVCPKHISIKVIGELNRHYRYSMLGHLQARRGPVKPQ